MLVRTRLIPPRLPRRWLARDRLDRMLSGIIEYPLTVVSAGAGYGKTTALAAFAAHGDHPVIWYSLGEGCDDPALFLIHLVHACRRSAAPRAGAHSLTALRHNGGGQVLNEAIDVLIDDLASALEHETVLVLDDYHTIDDLPEIRGLIERLIALRPSPLHLVLATRRRDLQIASIPTLRARGELLEIGEQDLAFTADEIALLFSIAPRHGLGPEEVRAIRAQTEGWAIGLQHLLQSGGIDGEGEGLSAYLEREVFAGQPADIREFLLRSAALAELRPDACDDILGMTGSAALLERLSERGLFLTAPGGGTFRYHPLFHAFLGERARALPEWNDLHVRAAEYYREVGDGEQVLYHLLATGDVSGAALELEQWIGTWLETGRLATLLAWTDRLPGEVLAAHPGLVMARGDAARFLARFDMALRTYEQAERIYEEGSLEHSEEAAGRTRALRGQAQVYIDTVQPSRAQPLLRQAYRLLPPNEGEDRGELVLLIAENWLNMGRPDRALRILDFGSRKSNIQNRALVRLGRLAEACSNLEAELPADRASVARGRPSRGHREITLTLSLIGALEGDAEAARRYAREGLEVARRLESPLFEAWAHICTGHALQLARPQDYRAVNEAYLQALALADSIRVPRMKAEAYMGLTLLHGFGGDLAAAEEAAQEGLGVVLPGGDEWTAAQIWTAIGAVATANRSHGAEKHLNEALKRYRTGKDTFGQAVVYLWLSVGHHHAGELEQATHCAIEAFDLAQQYGYKTLLTGATLFGPRDPMMLVPVLLAARNNPARSEAAQSLLKAGFPSLAFDDATQSYHPGVTLRIQTLGPMRVWRGHEEIGPHEWQRKKAQQMLALLITNRDHWLLREQICEWLWPELSEAQGPGSIPDVESQFKVTLNGLNSALEPLRPPRTPPFYIRRQGGAYRFFPPCGVWLDVEEFEDRVTAVETKSRVQGPGSRVQTARDPGPWTLDPLYEELTAAVELYQGEYLSDWLYEDWARDERQRLAGRYMQVATLLAEALIERDELSKAIRLCESILARDPGWEDAYCVLMRAHMQQGNRRLALAAYERCVRNLREYLDVDPLPSTVELYERVRMASP